MIQVKYNKLIFVTFLLTSLSSATCFSYAAPTLAPFHCADNVDCSNHGACNVTSGKCDCESGYIEANCSYKQKSQLTAFLLHFFLGMPAGAGAFYLEHYGLGAAQAFVTWSGVFSFFCSSRCDSDKCDVSGGKFMGILLISISVLGWGILGGCLADNNLEDRNNRPMKGW